MCWCVGGPPTGLDPVFHLLVVLLVHLKNFFQIAEESVEELGGHEVAFLLEGLVEKQVQHLKLANVTPLSVEQLWEGLKTFFKNFYYQTKKA